MVRVGRDNPKRFVPPPHPKSKQRVILVLGARGVGFVWCLGRELRAASPRPSLRDWALAGVFQSTRYASCVRHPRSWAFLLINPTPWSRAVMRR